MKNKLLPLLTVFLSLFIGCQQQKVDTVAEEEAIRAVIIEETDAFLTQDLVNILKTFAQVDDAIYISIGSNGFSEKVGYEEIKKYFKASTESDWSSYSDFKVDRENWKIRICGENALVYFDQRMSWVMKNEPMETHSKELRMLEKIKGEWKIVLLQWVDMSFFEAEVEKKTF